MLNCAQNDSWFAPFVQLETMSRENISRKRKRLSPVAVRYLIWGQRYRCACFGCKKQPFFPGCSHDIIPPDFEINHVVPFGAMGDDAVQNMVAVCRSCHGYYTQLHARWISLSKRLSPGEMMCFGCHKVVSPYFAKSHDARCDHKYTWALFPAAPDQKSIAILKAMFTPYCR